MRLGGHHGVQAPGVDTSQSAQLRRRLAAVRVAHLCAQGQPSTAGGRRRRKDTIIEMYEALDEPLLCGRHRGEKKDWGGE